MKTFIEWVAEDEYQGNIEHTKKAVASIFKDLVGNRKEKWGGLHFGDCTKEPQSCSICLLNSWLEDYYKYMKSFKS